jgi:class 3 adenylate cyclase
MLTAGCPTSMDDHAKRTIDCGFAILEQVEHLNTRQSYGLSLRIGIHSGPVIAGIIGKRKFSFDMWGDTVNIASRLESSGLPGRIHISESTKALVGERFGFASRGIMELKGQDPMQTWLVEPVEAAQSPSL